MSDSWIAVHSEDRNGDIEEHIIPTAWILMVSGSVNKGAYIAMSEEMAISCIESVKDIAKMIDAQIPLLELLESFEGPKKKVKQMKITKT